MVSKPVSTPLTSGPEQDLKLPQQCRWCRRPVVQPQKGRRREFCKRSCRQRDFESRQKVREHGLDEEQIIVARSSLNEMQDLIYVLKCSVEDIQRDHPSGFDQATDVEIRDALRWVLIAVEPVVTHVGFSG
jgi:endogenous inhibitor of DNA gyrase (YacG/DUF329 family)